MGYERLSPQDSVFLHLEDDHQPMHVGALTYLAAGPLVDATGRLRIDDLRRRIAGRLHHIPRFRMRLQRVPFEQGRPVWVDDPAFDITYHVRVAAVPRPGDESQVRELMGTLQSKMLDRRRPLWEVWFVEGIDGDRVGLIQKTHHCLADGAAGVEVAAVLLDLAADVADDEPPPWEPAPGPTPAELLLDSVLERTVEGAEVVQSVREALRSPREVLARVGDLARTGADLVAAAPPSVLNVPVGAQRRFAVARVPFDQAQAIARQEGTKVNDVVLAACTSSLRWFLDERGEAVDLTLRAMVPVSVRADAEPLALGNRVSMMAADLPVSEPDPLARLRALQRTTSALKADGQADAAESVIDAVSFVPPTLLGYAARLALRTRAVNVTISNVPGPPFPLYLMGARLLEAFPYMGVVDNMALVIAVISYDGQLGFGVCGDRDALPDLDLIAEGIELGFEELRAAVAVASAPTPAGPGVPSPTTPSTAPDPQPEEISP